VGILRVDVGLAVVCLYPFEANVGYWLVSLASNGVRGSWMHRTVHSFSADGNKFACASSALRSDHTGDNVKIRFTTIVRFLVRNATLVLQAPIQSITSPPTRGPHSATF
jgi:hypothetical protein